MTVNTCLAMLNRPFNACWVCFPWSWTKQCPVYLHVWLPSLWTGNKFTLLHSCVLVVCSDSFPSSHANQRSPSCSVQWKPHLSLCCQLLSVWLVDCYCLTLLPHRDLVLARFKMNLYLSKGSCKVFKWTSSPQNINLYMCIFWHRPYGKNMVDRTRTESKLLKGSSAVVSLEKHEVTDWKQS